MFVSFILFFSNVKLFNIEDLNIISSNIFAEFFPNVMQIYLLTKEILISLPN